VTSRACLARRRTTGSRPVKAAAAR
jgi:hypothetical protein